MRGAGVPILKIAIIVVIVLVLFIGVCGFIRRDFNTAFGNIGTISVAPASFWASVSGSECKISWKATNEFAGALILFDGRPEGPLFITSGPETNVIFCLYEFDVDLRLIKIRTSEPFQTLPAGCVLSRIVHKSSCKVDEGSVADWQFVAGQLKKLANKSFKRQSLPSFDLGFVQFFPDRETLIRRIVHQLNMSTVPDTRK